MRPRGSPRGECGYKKAPADFHPRGGVWHRRKTRRPTGADGSDRTLTGYVVSSLSAAFHTLRPHGPVTWYPDPVLTCPDFHPLVPQGHAPDASPLQAPSGGVTRVTDPPVDEFDKPLGEAWGVVT